MKISTKDFLDGQSFFYNVRNINNTAVNYNNLPLNIHDTILSSQPYDYAVDIHGVKQNPTKESEQYPFLDRPYIWSHIEDKYYQLDSIGVRYYNQAEDTHIFNLLHKKNTDSLNLLSYPFYFHFLKYLTPDTTITNNNQDTYSEILIPKYSPKGQVTFELNLNNRISNKIIDKEFFRIFNKIAKNKIDVYTHNHNYFEITFDDWVGSLDEFGVTITPQKIKRPTYILWGSNNGYKNFQETYETQQTKHVTFLQKDVILYSTNSTHYRYECKNKECNTKLIVNKQNQIDEKKTIKRLKKEDWRVEADEANYEYDDLISIRINYTFIIEDNERLKLNIESIEPIVKYNISKNFRGREFSLGHIQWSDILKNTKNKKFINLLEKKEYNSFFLKSQFTY